jgi:hypothetical protein
MKCAFPGLLLALDKEQPHLPGSNGRRARLVEPQAENSAGSFVPPAGGSSALDAEQTGRRDEFALPFRALASPFPFFHQVRG